MALKMEGTPRTWGQLLGIVSSFWLAASKEMETLVLQLQATKFYHNHLSLEEDLELQMRMQLANTLLSVRESPRREPSHTVPQFLTYRTIR